MKLIHVLAIVVSGFMFAGCASNGGSGLDILSGVLGRGRLDQNKISAGLKEALRVGAERAVLRLASPGGYENDQNLHIRLPGELGDMAKVLRQIGLGGQLDVLESKMNQAAESAAKQA